jgi:hypothetical protein
MKPLFVGFSRDIVLLGDDACSRSPFTIRAELTDIRGAVGEIGFLPFFDFLFCFLV